MPQKTNKLSVKLIAEHGNNKNIVENSHFHLKRYLSSKQ